MHLTVIQNFHKTRVREQIQLVSLFM